MPEINASENETYAPILVIELFLPSGRQVYSTRDLELRNLGLGFGYGGFGEDGFGE
jgi:hypothetical protein